METNQTPPPPKPTPLDESERLCWLRLIRTENIGPVTFERLLRQFRRASVALKALPDLARLGGKKSTLRIYQEDKALKEIDDLHKYGAEFIATCEPAYPPLLRETPGAPPLISVKGNIPILSQRSFAVVGARCLYGGTEDANRHQPRTGREWLGGRLGFGTRD